MGNSTLMDVSVPRRYSSVPTDSRSLTNSLRPSGVLDSLSAFPSPMRALRRLLSMHEGSHRVSDIRMPLAT